MALPRWAWAVIIVATLFIVGLVAMAAAGFYFFTQQMQITDAAPTDAAQRFDEARARFKDATPLIELDRDGDLIRSRIREAPAAPSGQAIEALHVLAWDADDERLVNAEVPFWLLRLNRGGPIGAFSDHEGLRGADLRITADDLERIGPALLVDHRSPDGGRVLVWTQ